MNIPGTSLAQLVMFLKKSSFVLCACVSSEHGAAGEPGAATGVSGCWRVKGGLQGARSVGRRRVCLETQGEHEWSLPDLLVRLRLYHVRVHKGRFDMQKKIKRCLFLRPK